MASMDLVDLLKTSMPWLTGGLGGAILTLAVKRWSDYRSEARLLLRTTKVKYAIPHEDNSLGEIHVSWGGALYAELSYCQMEMRNISNNTTIQLNPIILSLGDGSTILKSHSSHSVGTEPPPLPEQQDLPDGHYWFRVGALHPGDWIRLSLLVSGTGDFAATYRGDPKVKAIASADVETEPLIRDARLLGLLLAAFVVLGVEPSLGAIPRALLVLLALPVATRAMQRWRERKLPFSGVSIGRDVEESVVILGGDNTVNVSRAPSPELAAETRQHPPESRSA